MNLSVIFTYLEKGPELACSKKGIHVAGGAPKRKCTHGCNYQISQTSNHWKKITLKGPPPWKEITTGLKNPSVNMPYHSRLKRPKGLASQNVNNNYFQRNDVHRNSTMLGNHRETTAQNNSKNLQYGYDLQSTWLGLIHHSGPKSTDQNKTNYFYSQSEAQSKLENTQTIHGPLESHWPNHHDGPSSPSSHTTTQELDRETTIHSARKQTSHNSHIYPQTSRLKPTHITTCKIATRNSPALSNSQAEGDSPKTEHRCTDSHHIPSSTHTQISGSCTCSRCQYTYSVEINTMHTTKITVQ